MPIITNYPIAWTRFLLNTRILLATLPVSEFGTPPWDLEIWDATMRFRIKYAWTMAWSSFTPSVLFHYSRLCCRQSTTESGDLLLGCCSSYSLPVQLPAQTAIYLIELHVTAGTILLSNVFCAGPFYDSKSWKCIGWRHVYLSKVCSYKSHAVWQFDHPTLRIRPTYEGFGYRINVCWSKLA